MLLIWSSESWGNAVIMLDGNWASNSKAIGSPAAIIEGALCIHFSSQASSRRSFTPANSGPKNLPNTLWQVEQLALKSVSPSFASWACNEETANNNTNATDIGLAILSKTNEICLILSTLY